jgi:hypothetical protein
MTRRNLLAAAVLAVSIQAAGRVLVIIGAGQKPFPDAYLSRMMDMRVVQLEEFISE